MLEAECHVLDKRIATILSKTDCELHDNPFYRYVGRLRYINKLEQNKKTLIHKMKHTTSTPTEVATLERLTQSIQDSKKNATLGVLEGPVTANLDSVLQRHNIKVQAYHGRSFVGNHCHAYLQPHINDDICQSVVEKASELTSCNNNYHRAQVIAQKFSRLNSLFAEVHKAVSHGRPIPASEHHHIEESICQYMLFYRTHFRRVLPKMHMLEDHVLPWIRRWGTGMALHGEQGGESIHAEFNIQSSIAGGLKDGVRLWIILRKKILIFFTQNGRV